MPDTKTPEAIDEDLSHAMQTIIFPALQTAEAQVGRPVLSFVWAALTRSLVSLGATREQLHAGVDAQFETQTKFNEAPRH